MTGIILDMSERQSKVVRCQERISSFNLFKLLYSRRAMTLPVDMDVFTFPCLLTATKISTFLFWSAKRSPPEKKSRDFPARWRAKKKPELPLSSTFWGAPDLFNFFSSPSHIAKEKKLLTDTCGASRIFPVTSVGFGLITFRMFVIALARDEKAQEEEIS